MKVSAGACFFNNVILNNLHCAESNTRPAEAMTVFMSLCHSRTRARTHTNMHVPIPLTGLTD